MTVRAPDDLALLTDDEIDAALAAYGLSEAEHQALDVQAAEAREWLSRVEHDYPLAGAVLWQKPDAEWDQRRLVIALAASQHLTLVLGGNGSGKAQPLDAKVLTPTGWRQMGDLEVGDLVIAGDGSPTRVIGVHPQGRKPVLRLTFDDGATTRCCEEHLWVVQDGEQRFRKESTRYGTWGVMQAGEIRARWGEHPKPRRAVAIPVVGREDTVARDLPLDPYLLGLLLGDGGFTARTVSFTSADPELVEAVAALLPPGHRVVKRFRPYDWGIVGAGMKGGNAVIHALRDLGLMGLSSSAKHVPNAFKFASAGQRLALLQGLMDTDGHITAGGGMTFDSTSRQLAVDVLDLVRSLGGKATITGPKRNFCVRADGTSVPGSDSWRVYPRLNGVDLFRLPRKRARRHDVVATRGERVLRSIEPDGDAECQCIAVAHPSRTYVTDDYIVTHNTYAILQATVAQALGSDHPAVRCWLEDNDLPPDWCPPGPGEVGLVAPSAALSIEFHRKTLHSLLPAWGVHWRMKDAPQEASVEITVPGYDRVARIYCKSVDQKHRAFKGGKFRWYAISEEPEGEEGKLVMEECLRATARVGGRVVIECTPQSGMTWVHDDLYHARMYGCDVVEIDSSHNVLVDDYQGLMRWLESLPPEQRAMRQKGKFTDLRGLIYPSWSRGDGTWRGRGCLVQDFEIDPNWPRFRIGDWGQTDKNGTAVVWFALADDGTAVVYRVYYHPGEPSFTVHARNVRALESKEETKRISAAWADHEPDAVDAFALEGLHFEPADKDVVSGISRCTERLREIGGRPRLKVFLSAAKRWSFEVESYRQNPLRRDLSPIKKDDHVMDCWRYFENGVAVWLGEHKRRSRITRGIAGALARRGR